MADLDLRDFKNLLRKELVQTLIHEKEEMFGQPDAVPMTAGRPPLKPCGNRNGKGGLMKIRRKPC
jgi:hypothetical protein